MKSRVGKIIGREGKKKKGGNIKKKNIARFFTEQKVEEKRYFPSGLGFRTKERGKEGMRGDTRGMLTF